VTKLCRWRHLRTLRPMEREAKAEAAPARRLGTAHARAVVGGEEGEAEAAAPRQDLYGLFFIFTGGGGDEEEGAEASRRCARYRKAGAERRLSHQTVVLLSF